MLFTQINTIDRTSTNQPSNNRTNWAIR